jgi:uncharacterized protein YndB with AHSA1/START domain
MRTARPRDRSRRRSPARGAPPVGGGLGRRALGGARVDYPAPATPTRTRDVTDKTTLRMERTYQAPAQAVFDAWTSEEVIRRWFHAGHDWETTEAEVDLRVGGTVRVVMRNPHEDVEYGGGGRYTEIDPPNRLAFTWLWDGNDTRQLIELDFEETLRGRHHGPLHPQRPVGRGSSPLPRGPMGQGLRQPRTHARGGSPGSVGARPPLSAPGRNEPAPHPALRASASTGLSPLRKARRASVRGAAAITPALLADAEAWERSTRTLGRRPHEASRGPALRRSLSRAKRQSTLHETNGTALAGDPLSSTSASRGRPESGALAAHCRQMLPTRLGHGVGAVRTVASPELTRASQPSVLRR